MYSAWTIPREIESWFLSRAEFDRPNGEPVPRYENIEANDVYRWSWYLYEPTETGRVLEENGKDLLKFTFAGACVVEVKLTQHGDHVLVELTQNEIPADDASKREIRIDCDSGWSFFLVNLKSVYEGGLDLRNKNACFRGVVNY